MKSASYSFSGLQSRRTLITVLSFIFIIFYTDVKGQSEYKSHVEDDYFKSKDTTLLTPGAFNRVVKKDLEYVILGDNVPVAGLLLDLSSKLNAKISGQIPSEEGIHSLDLEAGQKDSNIPLFSEGRFNGSTTIRYNFHYIPFKNKYTFLKGANVVVDRYKKSKIIDYNDRMIDSASIIGYFMYEKDNQLYNELFLKGKSEVDLEDTRLKDKYGIYNLAIDRLDPNVSLGDINNKDLFLSLAKKYFPFNSFEKVSSIAQVDSVVQKSTNYKADLLIDDYNNIMKRLTQRVVMIQDAEGVAAKPYWGKKKLQWWTFSMSFSAASYKVFGKDINDQFLEPTTKPFLSTGLAIWHSRYKVYKEGGFLYRFGIEPVYGNNLKDFTEVKHYKRDTLQVEGNGDLLISEEVTSGIFKNKETEKRNQLYVNLNFEFYRLPKVSLIPGYTFKIGYVRDGILAKNTRKLRPQAGLVFNLLSKEKKQPILVIQPYVSYDNLLEETVLGKDDIMRSVMPKEKFGGGVLIGLPIKGLLAIE